MHQWGMNRDSLKGNHRGWFFSWPSFSVTSLCFPARSKGTLPLGWTTGLVAKGDLYLKNSLPGFFSKRCQTCFINRFTTRLFFPNCVKSRMESERSLPAYPSLPPKKKASDFPEPSSKGGIPLAWLSGIAPGDAILGQVLVPQTPQRPTLPNALPRHRKVAAASKGKIVFQPSQRCCVGEIGGGICV